jgi:hypothetical protein
LIEERYVGGAYAYRLCAKIRYLVLMGAYGDPQAARATGFVPFEERRRFRTISGVKRLPLVPEHDVDRRERGVPLDALEEARLA